MTLTQSLMAFSVFGIFLAHCSAIAPVLHAKGWTVRNMRHPFCHECRKGSSWWHELPFVYLLHPRTNCRTCLCPSHSVYAAYVVLFLSIPLLMGYDARAIASMLVLASVFSSRLHRVDMIPRLYILLLLLSGLSYGKWVAHDVNNALLGFLLAFGAGLAIALPVNLFAGRTRDGEDAMIINSGELKLFAALGSWIGYQQMMSKEFVLCLGLAWVAIGVVWLLVSVLWSSYRILLHVPKKGKNQRKAHRQAFQTIQSLMVTLFLFCLSYSYLVLG